MSFEVKVEAEHKGIMQYLRHNGHTVTKGKSEFVKKTGLRILAAHYEVESCITEAVEINMATGTCIMRCTVSGPRGTFVDFGSATPANLGKMVVDHFVEMASTRAQNRALAQYVGAGVVSDDELAEDDDSHRAQNRAYPINDENADFESFGASKELENYINLFEVRMQFIHDEEFRQAHISESNAKGSTFAAAIEYLLDKRPPRDVFLGQVRARLKNSLGGNGTHMTLPGNMVKLKMKVGRIDTCEDVLSMCQFTDALQGMEQSIQAGAQ
mgnify:CR=1 FL=1